ncbi:MAG: histidine kinase, partial [Leptolyngbya sp.]|nr:histidine kinase [Candidatus Melainabacteria bacterium]
MIALLLKQFGIESNSVSDVVLNFPGQDTPTSVGIDEIVMDQDQATFNVFFVPNAVDSPYIYQQEDFVKPYGVKSVLGFGGILSAGQIFAVLLFSKATIKKEIAQRFKPLALSTKNAILQAPPDKVFALSELS